MVQSLVSGCAGVVIVMIAGHDAVDEHGKFAGGGSNGLGLAGTRREAPVEGTEGGRGASETHRAAAQNGCGAIGRGRSPGAEQASARDLVVRRQGKPGSKVFFGGPTAHVGPDLGNDLQRGMRSDAVDLAEVGAASESMERAADVEGRCPFGTAFAARLGQWCSRQWFLLGQLG